MPVYRIQHLFFSLFFIFINTLFLIKYGYKYEISIPISILVYTGIQALILFGKKYVIALASYSPKKSYLCVVLLLLTGIFLITTTVDRYALNVDRWSAMEVAIKAVFSGEYPYTAIDHLGGRTSNFPGLLLLGMPFYLLGDVGYFQIFAFGLLSFTLYKVFPLQQALYTLLLLFVSLPFWYEIVVISDFMSNIVVVLSFIMLWQHYFSRNAFEKPIVLALFLSILLLTRGLAYVPIALYLFSSFVKLPLKKQLFFVCWVVSFSVLLLLMVLINCPSMDTLQAYNPLVLQTSYTSGYIVLFTIVAPLILSFRIKSFYNDFFTFSFVVLCIAIMVIFIQFWIRVGFDALIHNSVFDLAYLASLLPFIWIVLSDQHSKTTDITLEI